MIRTVLIALSSLLVIACAPLNRATHPDDVLARYVEAMSNGDIDGAYTLLSEAQRQQTSLEEFRAAAQRYPEELEAQTRELRRQMEEPIPVSAEIRLESGEVATFVLEGGQWRVAEGAAGAVSLSSPLHTIRALRRALQRRSYGEVARVLSREARAQVEDEIARIVEGLEDEGSLTVEITGNRARIVYDENHFVDLQREDGEWVIVDMN